MSLEGLRAYARKAARELSSAGISPSRAFLEGGESRTTQRQVGRRPPGDTVEDPAPGASSGREVKGWPVWVQTYRSVAYRTGSDWRSEGHWDLVNEIWLTTEGDLVIASVKTRRWENGQSKPDIIESLMPASDNEILRADQAWYREPKPPRVPGGNRTGLWESNTSIRNAEPLRPGRRVSMGITDLRKIVGTYEAHPKR